MYSIPANSLIKNRTSQGREAQKFNGRVHAGPADGARVNPPYLRLKILRWQVKLQTVTRDPGKVSCCRDRTGKLDTGQEANSAEGDLKCLRSVWHIEHIVEPKVKATSNLV